MPVISAQFREIKTAPQLEQIVTAVLKEWFPTYLRELERQLDLQPGIVKDIATFTTRQVFDALPGEELPKCVVVSPGLAGPPRKRGGNSYDCDFRIAIGVAIAAPDEETGKLLAGVYSGAARGIMLSKHMPYNVTWRDESYDDITFPGKTQLYKASADYFEIEIQNVVTAKVGPDTPDESPDSYVYGQVQEVIIVKQLEGLSG